MASFDLYQVAVMVAVCGKPSSDTFEKDPESSSIYMFGN